ncbi:MAG: hypothetical protein JW797_17575 [Bradymonadales bacterium]|nr:hypothetical protein [Bradymonadales bacterium]
MGTKVLKNELSKYLRYAEQGETILVCDRDRVVAVLSSPPPSMGNTVSDVYLADAIRQGFITPALMPAGPQQPSRKVASLEELLQELALDRRER